MPWSKTSVLPAPPEMQHVQLNEDLACQYKTTKRCATLSRECPSKKFHRCDMSAESFRRSGHCLFIFDEQFNAMSLWGDYVLLPQMRLPSRTKGRQHSGKVPKLRHSLRHSAGTMGERRVVQVKDRLLK
ncbi:hypothetical protein AVEN_260164-1 [Araneus ventricosus]|uniref:Uncharacterized protein n=1 Tax=Araneus ventricosus TaxID=182803 RepID=A0A4Y2DM36_ARAVE|nr:hypothetical protein AVEN_260164-1 [Araneus ventricosus]